MKKMTGRSFDSATFAACMKGEPSPGKYSEALATWLKEGKGDMPMPDEEVDLDAPEPTGDMETPAGLAAEMPGGSADDTVNGHLSDGFKAALQALVDDDTLTADEKIAKMTKLLKAHEELTAKEVAEQRHRPFARRS